ncbi:MAG TPA: HIT family protein [Turneriella sp.]|nr:HIT family protein [Turneriella sp.]
MSKVSFTLDAQLAADTLAVTDLSLCTVRLMNTTAVPWLVLAPQRPDKKEIIDLNISEQAQLWKEITAISHVLKDVFNPTKLNVAALGNAQLHIHVIARFANDAAWPQPVWGKVPMEAYLPEVAQERINKITHALNHLS